MVNLIDPVWAKTGSIESMTDPKIEVGHAGADQPPIERLNFQAKRVEEKVNELIAFGVNVLKVNHTLEISDATTLTAAQVYIAALSGIYDGAILNVYLTANVSVSNASYLLDFQSISGRGAINIKSSGGSYTLENTGAGGVVRINSVSSYTILDNNLSLKCTTGRAVDVSYSIDVLIKSIALASSGGIGIYAIHSSCSIDSPFGTGYSKCCEFLYSNMIFLPNVTFGLPTSNLVSSIDCDISFTRIKESMIPMGSAATGLLVPFSFDNRTTFNVEGYGTSGVGTSTSPYLITMTTSDVGSFAKDLNRLLACFPKLLDVHIKIKLPAGTFTTDDILIEDFHGAGGLDIEANTTQIAPTTSQDSIFSEEIQITRCRLAGDILLHSIACDYLLINTSNSLDIKWCYFTRTAGASVSCSSSNLLYFEGCKISGPAGSSSGMTFSFNTDAFLRDCDENGSIQTGLSLNQGSTVKVEGTSFVDGTTNDYDTDSGSLIIYNGAKTGSSGTGAW